MDELAILRDMLNSHQISIQKLNILLEEERNASASTASKAMSMTLRLQREKVEIQMECRQFKRYTNKTMKHDSEEIAQLENLLYKKEQDVESLGYELQVCKNKLLCYKFYYENKMQDNNVTSASKDSEAFAAAAVFDYPMIECKVPTEYENGNNFSGGCDMDKYALGKLPGSSHGYSTDTLLLTQLQGCTILSGDAIIRHLAALLMPGYVLFLMVLLDRCLRCL